MTDADKDASTSATTSKPPPSKPKLTNRSAGLIALTVLGGGAAIGLFALFGPLAAAAVPVAAAGGGYVQHRLKNPKRSTGRQKRGWSLTWGKSGGQSRRALSRLGIGSKRNAGAGSGRTGAKSRSSRLPASGPLLGKGRGGSRLATTRSRAANGAGGVLPKHKGRRSVPSLTTGNSGRFAGVKPKGVRAPKTASKTAARPATSQRLTGPKRAASTSPKRSTPGRSSTTRRPNLRLLQGGKSSKAGRSGSPSLTRKAAPSGRRSTSGKVGSPVRRGGMASRAGRTMRRLNPLTRTSPSGRHSRLKRPFRRTGLNPRKAIRRDRVPRRTAKRPVPYKRTRALALWRLALGVPARKGNKLERISAAKRARARRTLRLRTLTRLLAIRHFPGLVGKLSVRMSRSYWDRIWSRVPAAPKPEHEWLTYAPRPKAVVAPGPRHAVPKSVPFSTAMEAVPMSSTPQQIIIEAFGQLAAYHTQNATEMEQHLASDPEMWGQIGQSITSFADSVQSTMPYGPATCDALRDLAAAVATIGDLSKNVHATFRSEHEEKLQRIESPMADEGQWDIGRQ